jgi:cell fate regulator YaaT (PSP1 superfamily)
MEEQETTFVPADEEPIQEPEEALTPEAETPEEAAEPETPETPDTEPEAPAESEAEPEAPAESEAEPEAPEAAPETERPEEPATPPEPVTPAEAEAELEQAESEIEQAEAADQPDTPPEPPLVTVVDIHFRNNVKTYFFDPGELVIPAGGHVVIDTARGDEFGFCATGNHQVRASEIVPPLRKVLRLATPQDERVNRDNQDKEKRAFDVCQQKIAEHKLDMQLVSAECAFDGSKILFFFTADGRVDFRELVKDLASVFRTRIELRQIGVRDKAKMVGGLGICGRPFCCKEFLDDFQPVSIKMAKTQNLSLNPTKISGTCGRLMCCLKYEQDAYEDLLRTSPKNESFVDTPDGRGTVTDVNLLRQCVKVRMEDHPETIGCYQNCDICVLRSGKARKNDPPIPKDIAPISSHPRPAVKKPEPEAFEAMPDVIYPDSVASVEPVPVRPIPEKPAPQPEAPEAAAPREGEKTGAPRRRHRSRGRGKGPQEGGQSASAPREGAEARPAPKPQGEQRRPAPKPQGEQRPAADRPQGEPRPAGSEQPRRRRPRGRRSGGGNGNGGGAGTPPAPKE